MASRYDFRQAEVSVLGPVSCYLCGCNVDSEEGLAEHLKNHLQHGAQAPERLLEEYRKRVLFHEESEGPFPVSGAEVRRAASNHAWQSSHSYCGGDGAATYVKKATLGEERGLGSCAVCAQTRWKEELADFYLFVKPTDNVELDEEDPEGTVETENGLSHGVRRDQVRKVNELLSADEYRKRWPKIPLSQIRGTSVKHPFLEDAWWLLDTKVLTDILTEEHEVRLDARGQSPPVKACWVCAYHLRQRNVSMPPCALANNNLMLRPPGVFQDERGNPLSDATLLLLALARAVVIKEVAEPLREVAREEQQEVLKGNTIALPQADCRVLVTQKLPASEEILRPFLQEHLAVVFCGKDVSEASSFPKLEVDWEKYSRAVRFLIAHNPEYEKVELDEEAAKIMFQGCGIPNVIRELITKLNVDSGFVQPEGAAAEAWRRIIAKS